MAAWLSRVQSLAGRQLAGVWGAVVAPAPDHARDDRIAEQARSLAPIVWMLGKVQSGKSSIVRALTRSTEAEVGQGFAACTRTARIFDFPADAPVIRFLDTRGLGEPGYDAREDLAFSERQAHLVLAVMKATDHDQGPVVEVVAQARRRHPEWPVVVAQTSLHEAYALGAEHPDPYPFGLDGGLPAPTAGLPPDLLRSLEAQRARFAGLPGSGPVAFVALDFTRESDGYRPADYGHDALIETLRATAPAGLVSSLQAAHAAAGGARERAAHPHIVGYATAAAAADVVPLAGFVAVPGVQAKMLHSLGLIYGIEWDRRTLGEFAAALGTGTALRALSAFGIREIAKLIPVYGQTAGAAAAAAASFAMTYALGKAAGYFLARRRRGPVAPGDVAATYRAALDEAFRLARERDVGRESREQAS